MNSNCLFSRITVISPTDDRQLLMIADAWVSVADGRIRYAGQSEMAAREQFSGLSYETYDGRGKFLLPAMANTHGHLAMTLMRNQADDRNLHDWLFNTIIPLESRLNSQNVYHGTQLALTEMIRSGTGAAADMYYFHESAVRAALESGFRLNFCYDAKTVAADGSARVSHKNLAEQIAQSHDHPTGLLRVSLLVHSVYLYDTAIYPQLAQAASTLNCPVQIHISETQKEVDDCLARYHCRPPRQLEKFGFFQTPTLAAHCVFLDEEDRKILACHQVVVAHNPSSNLKLGSGFADISALRSAGVPVSLGTDGAASNNNLDLYREMRLASLLAKGLSGDASVLPASDAIFMATRQGMLGLGFADSGCIMPGWQADLQIVDHQRPAMTPLGDPAAALVYSADSSCVESLMVAGRWLMYKRELKTIDEEKVLFEAARESANHFFKSIVPAAAGDAE
jgi:5-methylthioadenosine/S-adenosylhomocysteine deaminase